jgi:hypothetical protein
MHVLTIDLVAATSMHSRGCSPIPRSCAIGVRARLSIRLAMNPSGIGALSAATLLAALGLADAAASMSRSPCTSQETRKVVASFIVNFNDGDLRRLNQLISPAGLFKWYSVAGTSGRINDASRDRATLISYFASRHRQGERLSLRSFQWKGYSLGYGEFLYSLTRTARDVEPTSYFGKGALLCLRPRTISVWSMGPQ